MAALVLLLAVVVVGCDPVATEQADPPVAESSVAVAVEPAAPVESTASPAAESTAPAPAPPAAASPTPTEPGTPTTAFVAVVDGDTIETSAGTVRLIGIDTPERGECGHDEASSAIGRLVSTGDPVTLELPEGQNDRDRYDRLIRYVITADGVDLGLLQLQAGNAIARYDSTDGYPRHPQEAAYHAAQIATSGSDGSVVTTSCQSSAPQAVASLDSGDDWWVQYSSCTKLKRNTAGHPTGPFSVDDPVEADIYDWFAYGTGNRGDGDGDGLACE